MDDGMEELQGRRVRLRGWRLALAALLLALAAAFVILWLFRVRLATHYIDAELARRGVQATYEVKRIGFGKQVFENLVIGDPDRPDATARRLEVAIGLSPFGVRIGTITGRGVRLYGQIRDGRLSLGQIDRLLPPPSGLPFRLPDQRVDLEDAAILLDTPSGRLAVGLTGRGNLSDGFRGEMALVSSGLTLGTCLLASPRAKLDVRIDDLRPQVDGPVALPSLSCGDGLAVRRLRLGVDAQLSPALDSWRGEAALESDRASLPPQELARARARLTFEGNARRTTGALDLRAEDASLAGLEAAALAYEGGYRVSPTSGDLELTGRVAAEGLRLDRGSLAAIAASLRAAGGTPVGPIGDQLASAVERASRSGSRFSGRLELVSVGGKGRARIGAPTLVTGSGARFAGDRTSRVAFSWPEGRSAVTGNYALEGGGFPAARVQLSYRNPRSYDGVARIAPMSAAGAKLVLAPVRFRGREGGLSFSTTLTADGPVGDGRIRGLRLPVAGSIGPGGLRVGESCTGATFAALEIEGLALGPSRFTLCPTGRAIIDRPNRGALRFGAAIRPVRFAGRLDQTPVGIGLGGVRIDAEGFAARDVSVSLGGGSDPNQLDVGRLEAAFVRRGVAGRFADLSGKIANVPLLIDEGEGEWSVVAGDLAIDGGLRVSDAQDPSRFYPLVSRDFALGLVDGRIRAAGALLHPSSGRHVADARIEHDLSSGKGKAVLDVPGLAFDSEFQPDSLTRLTLGVVALVRGTVTGQGLIEWGDGGTRSSGSFGTDDMDLAAPFGPVEGLATRIRFTDLLGLVSAPDQVARTRLIRAGIDVYDGEIRYQLLPDLHVGIEGARWPLAGGELFLEPTILDFSESSTKRLTFRVVGLDAARFIQQMEFSNIAATGTFDGVIPMIFDIRGGRIVGGRLAARPGGGTLSYVGELTDRDLGVYGKLAFDALKELSYNRFDMTLDGALDGEFVTRIDLDGIARNPSGPIDAPGGAIGRAVVGRVLSQVARIPFEFNIRIAGPFRALIATARSFEDPSILIQPVLPQLLRDLPTTVSDVQDEESENEP